METRKARQVGILGEPGCGKTTLALQLAKATGKKKVLIIDESLDVAAYKQYPIINAGDPKAVQQQKWMRSTYDPGQDVFQNLKANFKHGVLLLDDCSNFVDFSSQSKEMKALRSIFAMRRHLDIDIIFMSHGFTLVPNFFYPFLSHLVLFKTTDSAASRKSYINNFDAVVAVKNRVDAKGQQDIHYKEIMVLQSD